MNRYSRSLVVDGVEMPWTFKIWVSNFKKVELPIGALAVDISKDKSFPDNDSYDEILLHLQSRTDDPEILGTFRIVWEFYKTSTQINFE